MTVFKAVVQDGEELAVRSVRGADQPFGLLVREVTLNRIDYCLERLGGMRHER